VGRAPIYGLFEEIAKIISYNVFQMDGLTYTVPLSEKREKIHDTTNFRFLIQKDPKKRCGKSFPASESK
jgi:hypothetical protein